MKKYVSVALATAMIASMGVTAFAKNDQYKYDVKDVTFINKTDNGDDEIYFQLKVKKGNTEAFIVDDATTANGNVADKEKALKEEMAAYKTAREELAKITAGDIKVKTIEDKDVVDYAGLVIDGLNLDATVAGNMKQNASVTGLKKTSTASDVVTAIQTAATKEKTDADNAKKAADALVKAYAALDEVAEGTLKTADPATASDLADFQGKLKTDIKGFIDGKSIADLAANASQNIANEVAASFTTKPANKADAVTAIKKLKDNAAATQGVKDAEAKVATAQKAVTAAQDLDDKTLTVPVDGTVTVDSLTADLQAFLKEDSKYENDIVKMVVGAVDLTKDNTPDAVATAIQALAAPTAKAANIFDEKQESLQGQIDSLVKADYVSYDDIEDIDDLKASLKLTAGEDYVADYYIDEIDDKGAAHDGNYGIIIELNDNYTTSKQKIKGTLTLKNKTKKLEEMDFSYNLDIHKVDVEGDGVDGDYAGIKEMTFDGEDVYINLVEFNADYNVAKFTKDVENIELEDDNGFYFDVKASDQGKLNLAYDNVAIKSVTKVAPVDADLTFFNFYGYPTFDFTGTVTLTPEEDDVEYFVYKVDKDGKISKVNAKLNDDGDAYEFKTRTLGCYVLSDMELNVDDINAGETTPEDKPADGEGTTAPDTTVKPNPGTGL